MSIEKADITGVNAYLEQSNATIATSIKATKEVALEIIHPLSKASPESRDVLTSRFYRVLVENIAKLESNHISLEQLRDETIGVLLAYTETTPSFVLPMKGIPVESGKVAASLRTHLLQQLSSLKETESIRTFFHHNNVFLKLALSQRIYASQGVNLEPILVEDDLPASFLQWLSSTFAVKPGDTVLHRHVQNKSIQDNLHSAGITNAYTGWTQADYSRALDVAAELMSHNTSIKGIISEGSWIYDPAIHNMAPDGRPYIAARFLKHDNLTGDRRHIPREEIPDLYPTQLMFASKSTRRKAFIEEGVWSPEVYGAFYPKDKLFEYLHRFRV